LFLLAALNLLFVAADLFNLYVTLELMGIAAVALVALEGEKKALVAAFRYLLVGLLGSLCYLLGVGLIYATKGSVELLQYSEAVIVGGPSFAIALALMSGGLLFKAGLFPFHFWLPPAHAGAPAPVSAMLSALVVEAAFYILLRLWFELAPIDMLGAAQYLPAVLGTAAVFWGGLNALRATRLKMMVAYSTVSQLGYLFLAIPLIVKVGLAAWSGAALLVLAHALAKGAMFLGAGTVLVVAGHDRVTELAGAARRLPLTMLSFALAGISLIGLPPSGGFLAKWLLFNAALFSEQWWAVLVLLLGSLLSAVYILKVVAFAFVQNNSKQRIASGAPAGLEWSAFVLALLAVLLGFFGSAATDLLSVGSPVAGPLLNERSP
jgi:formate hydrogenlyase subunit 3/multisubunit Na+/H+ antiporter MnhD subunit